jgi:hypothetical protein
MADSATPKPTPANFPSLDALAHLPAWAVALSGGADSTALLIASALRWPDKTHAIHVHHGLQDADRWICHPLRNLVPSMERAFGHRAGAGRTRER